MTLEFHSRNELLVEGGNTLGYKLKILQICIWQSIQFETGKLSACPKDVNKHVNYIIREVNFGYTIEPG